MSVVRVGKEKGDGESIFQSGETDAIPIDLLLNHFKLFPKLVCYFDIFLWLENSLSNLQSSKIRKTFPNCITHSLVLPHI